MSHIKRSPLAMLATAAGFVAVGSKTARAVVQTPTETAEKALDSAKEAGSAASDALGPLISQAKEFLPKLGGALAILVIGWIIAKVIAWVIAKVIRRTPLNGLLAKYFPGDNPDAAKPLSLVVYYILMLFVLIGFFQALQLDMITRPLNSFLDQVFIYAPRFLAAGILSVVAWVVARVVKTISFKGLTAANIDSKLASLSAVDDTDWDQAYQTLLQKNTQVQEAVAEGRLTKAKVIAELKERRAAKALAVPEEGSMSLSKTISETGYWLVFLLFLPAILGALKMPGILEPIQGMMSRAMDYIPNIIGAGIIFAIGWFVAKIVKQIVSNLLAAAGADRLTQKAGLDLGATKLSGLLGTVAHAFVLLPVLVAALGALKIDAVTAPATLMLNKITGAVPGIFGGVVVIGIAVFVGKIVSTIVTDVLKGTGADHLPAKLGIAAFEGTADGSEAKSFSGLVGKLVLVATVLFAALQALPMMGLSALGGQMEDFMGLAGNVVLAVVVFGLGLYLANLAAGAIRGLGINNSAVLANVARWSIVVLAGTMALSRSGLAPASVVNLAFGLILGAIALAASIAFGWGGRDVAKRFLEERVG